MVESQEAKLNTRSRLGIWNKWISKELQVWLEFWLEAVWVD